MTKRNTQQRRHGIVTLLQVQGEVNVDAHAKRFDTSEVTIRKDLTVLETGALRELEHDPTLLMTGGTWEPHTESF